MGELLDALAGDAEERGDLVGAGGLLDVHRVSMPLSLDKCDPNTQTCHMTSTAQTHTICHNPACARPLERRDAFLRSVSLEQVAFCSAECIEAFTLADKAAHAPVIPLQRTA